MNRGVHKLFIQLCHSLRQCPDPHRACPLAGDMDISPLTGFMPNYRCSLISAKENGRSAISCHYRVARQEIRSELNKAGQGKLLEEK